MGRFLKWMLISLALIMVLPMLLIGYAAWKSDQVPKSSILHVVFDGPLPESPHPSIATLVGGHAITTLRSTTQAIRRAAADERIVGMVLDVRQPQLGLAQLSELGDALDDFRQSGKWNVAYLETAGELGHGDGAFALSTLVDEVYLSPPGEVNLNGLRAEVPFVKDTLARMKVQPYTEQRYEYKNFANTFTHDKFTPEHKEALKGVLDDMQGTLLEIIADGRDVDPNTVHRWVTEAPFDSNTALAQKLVDHVAYWDEVVNAAEKIAGRDDPFIEAESYGARRDINAHGVPVAIITASGEISRGEGGGGMGARDGIGSETFTQAFRDARDDGMKAVVLRIDSPGGSYVASDLIRREVELTRKAGIPVVVSMGNTAASGGYFIAADADYIVAQPGTITGSIGVFAASFAVREALQHWLGVTFDTYETIPHPGSLNWLDAPTDADKVRLAKTLDRIYSDFVTKVANGRHKTYEEIHKVAKGRIWSGNQAVANGLVDEIGGIDEALAYVRKRLELKDDDTLRIGIYPEPENTWALLREVLSAQAKLPTHLHRVLEPFMRLASPMEVNALLMAAPQPL